jgi:hypothetical protein
VELTVAVNVTVVSATAGLLLEDKLTAGVNGSIFKVPVAEPA